MVLKDIIKQRPAAYEKWREIRDIMATHITGKPPRWLFITRRPIESTNEYALEYRIQNFQPITKQPFNTAIAAILESANHIYVDEKNVDDNTREFVNEYEIRVAGKKFTHKGFIIDYVGRMAEQDPNAVLVHVPLHPTETLVPDYREEIPDFNSVTNEFVDIAIYLVGSEGIIHLNEDEVWFEAGEWLYTVKDGKDKFAPYYICLDREWTRLAIPFETKEGIDYRMHDYYFNDLESPPFDIIGNNSVLEDIDGEIVECHESTYAGGVAIGNEMLGLHSDSMILNTRYTYPEKMLQMKRCPNSACVPCSIPDSPYKGLYVNMTGNAGVVTCTPCSTCGGSGQVAPDTGPLGTWYISKSDVFDSEGKHVPLVSFVTPPIEAPRYMSEETERMYVKMERALFIMTQNMTNQSGESKSYDVKQKVSVISGAVRNIYSIYENSLNVIQGFLRGDEDIVVSLPPDFNIKTTEDITMELNSAKTTSSIYTSELTKELILKKFGNTATTRKMVDFLEEHDLLFGMNPDEVLKAVISYPVASRTRLQAIHDKGLAVLKQIAKEDGFLGWSEDEIKRLFDARIDRIAPNTLPPSPIA